MSTPNPREQRWLDGRIMEVALVHPLWAEHQGFVTDLLATQARTDEAWGKFSGPADPLTPPGPRIPEWV